MNQRHRPDSLAESPLPAHQPLGLGRIVDRVAYQPGLDGIRGLAASAVFLVHHEQNSEIDASMGPFSLQQFCIIGRHAVAAFFLPTGYLLAGPLWSSPASERIDRTLKQFWTRRAAKLLPIYLPLRLRITRTQT